MRLFSCLLNGSWVVRCLSLVPRDEPVKKLKATVIGPECFLTNSSAHGTARSTGALREGELYSAGASTRKREN